MKKIISILTTFTTSFTSFASVVSCKNAVAKDLHHNNPSEKIDSEQELETNLTIDDLKNGIDGSHFTTNNTIGDALDKIQEKIMQNFPNIAEIILPNEEEAQVYLKPGDNVVHIGIKVTSKDNIKKIKTIIKNVQEISDTNDVLEPTQDNSKSIELITTQFVQGFDGSHLSGWNTIYDALEYFQNEAKKINKNAIISFSDEYLEKNIGENKFNSFAGTQSSIDEDSLSADQLDHDLKTENILTYKSITSKITNVVAPGSAIFVNGLKQIGKTLSKAAVSTGKLIGKGAKYIINKTSRAVSTIFKNYVIPNLKKFNDNHMSASVKKGVNYVTQKTSQFTTWLTKKFHMFTHIKDAFLKGKEAAFDLNLTFTDPLVNPEIPISSTNIKSKLTQLQERSRETAKKIIEKEHLRFQHAINFRNALEAFRKHIEASLFPTEETVDPKRAFQLRTVFKNQRDETKILKKGLNLIPVVLKPNDSWKNWLWSMVGQKKSDLDVQIHVYLE